MKKTVAVLLENILERLGKLENQLLNGPIAKSTVPTIDYVVPEPTAGRLEKSIGDPPRTSTTTIHADVFCGITEAQMKEPQYQHCKFRWIG